MNPSDQSPQQQPGGFPYGPPGQFGAFPQPGGQPPQRKRGRVILFSVLGVVVLLIAVIVISGLVKKTGQSGQQTSDTNTPSAAPGQTNVLTQLGPQGSPVTYGSTTMFDACTLVPESLVTQSGLALDLHASDVHQYVERSVPTNQATVTNALISEPPSSCEYELLPQKDGSQNNAARHAIIVSVNQAPFNSQTDIQSEQAKITGQTHSASGVTWAQEERTQSAGTTDFTLRFAQPNHPDLLVEIQQFGLTDPYGGKPLADIVTDIANGTAKNIAAVPTGPMKLTFNSPKYQGVQTACQVFDQGTFTSFANAPDSGVVTETNSKSEELLVNTKDNTANYRVDSECLRRSPDDIMTSKGKSLDVTFTIFQDATQGAEGQGECDPNGPGGAVYSQLIQVSTSVGDGKTCVGLNQSAGWFNYLFKVGRTVVSFTDRSSAISNINQWTQQMTPVAQALAAKLH